MQASFSIKKFHGVALDCWIAGFLRKLSITVLGDALAILQLAKDIPPSEMACAKPPEAKLPESRLEMTKQHFRKFEVDWNVFIKMTHLPAS